MKTIAELARELNISTQAIYKKINKSLKAELSPHIKTVNGQRVIDEQGIIIIKTSLQPPFIEVANHEKQLQTNLDIVANQVEECRDIAVANHTTNIPTDHYCIYRFLNASEDVLYIGLTKHLRKRINIAHFSGRGHLPDECYLETKKVEYALVKDSEDPEDKENYYIRKYRPKYNTIIGHSGRSANYNDEWLQFDFIRNTDAIYKKNIRAAKLEKENIGLKESLNSYKENLAFYKEQYEISKNDQSKELDYSRKQIEMLQDELNKEREHSRTQADRLANLAEQLAELSRNNQILLGAEQSRTNPALLMGSEEAKQNKIQPIKKKSFWSLFKKP